MNKFLFFKSNFFKEILFCILCITNFCVFSAANPVDILQKSANQVITVLANHQKELHDKPAIINKAVHEFILPQVDVAGMSRSVLGRNSWNNANSVQREEFAKLFTELVIRTYATPLANYKDETIVFTPSSKTPSGRFTKVSSIITSGSGKKITLIYSLVLINNQWKIYDFSVEGVSLLQSFRTQLAQVLNQSSMEQLLKSMHNKANWKNQS